MSPDERKFLHDIANKVSIAYCSADLLRETVAEPAQSALSREELTAKLEKILQSLDAMTTLIRERRQCLVDQMSKEGEK